MQKTFYRLFGTVLFVSTTGLLLAQQSPQTTIQITDHGTINFLALAQKELLNPPPLTKMKDNEEKMDREKIPHWVPTPDAIVTKITLPSPETPLISSPAPLQVFNGILDNNMVIPPDVDGVVGPANVMETTNQQYQVKNKTGGATVTLSLASFWSGITTGSPYSDPHIEYDATSGHWITCIIAQLNNGHYGIFVAVSQTTNPSGAWNEYSIDTGSSSTLPDYPQMGYNVNWVVITVNDFTSTFQNVKIFMMSKSSMISGTLGTVTTTTDNTSGLMSASPAQTTDVTQTTEYILTEMVGMSKVRLGSVTGTSTPVYNTGVSISSGNTWSSSEIDATQKGTSVTITTDDARMHDVMYRNGSIWGAHHVYLSGPSRSAVQWWQINPATNAVQQFGRLDDAATPTFYYYPDIAVNANNDVLITFTFSSTNDFASAGYAYRTSSDPANTLETRDVYKAGLATYNKTFGSGRNRWGDYNQASVDPTDGSLWALTEFANTPANNYGTVWAQVPASGAAVCNTPSGLGASAITSSSATLSWGGVGGAASYEVRYRPTGTTPWTKVATAATSIGVSGLASSTQYEFQAQSVCGAGDSSTFSASFDFTTLSAVCNTPSGLGASAITSSSATLSWGSVAGAASYEARYRKTGTTPWTRVATAATSIGVTGLTASTQYEFQAQSVCGAGDSSTFSASFNFTTLSAGCTDIGEPNNTRPTGTPIAVNTNILAQLSFAGDVDWYKFSNTVSLPNIIINLTTLPFNYNLFLYSPSGTLLASSKKTGTQNDQIIFNTSTVGTYNIKINSPKSFFSTTQCYTLNAGITAGPNVPVSLQSPDLSADNISIYPDPNTGTFNLDYYADNVSQQAVIKVFDMLGRLVYSQTSHFNEGNNHLSLTMPNLTNGVYSVQINTGYSLDKSSFEIQK